MTTMTSIQYIAPILVGIICAWLVVIRHNKKMDKLFDQLTAASQKSMFIVNMSNGIIDSESLPSRTKYCRFKINCDMRLKTDGTSSGSIHHIISKIKKLASEHRENMRDDTIDIKNETGRFLLSLNGVFQEAVITRIWIPLIAMLALYSIEPAKIEMASHSDPICRTLWVTSDDQTMIETYTTEIQNAVFRNIRALRKFCNDDEYKAAINKIIIELV